MNSRFSWAHASLVAMLLLILTLVFAACTHDYTRAIPAPDEALVVVSLNVPVATRSLTAAQEDAVMNIQVLAFDADGKFAYSAHSNNTADNQTFKVKLRKGTWDLVILANSSFVLAGLVEGTPREDLLAGLTATVTAGRGWATEDLKTYGIPMSSGLLTDNEIDDVTTVGNVDLYRMVAKVDVSVVEENFTLESVRVYNYERKGAVYPTFSGDHPVFAEPSTGSDRVMGYTDDALIYDISDYPDGFSNRYCGNLIYLNPSEAGDRTTLQTNTCLVVGGRYAEDTEVTYYRVDFSTSDGTYLDLVRNHKYIISINKVGGSGEATENDAFDRQPVNMTVEIVDWDEADVADVVVYGQYGLGVNKKNFVFYANEVSGDGDENRLTISTTYTGEWEVESVSEWLKVTRENSGETLSLHTCAGSVSTSTILSENFYLQLKPNTTGQSRDGYVTVSTGKGLNQLVKVTQGITSSHTLAVRTNVVNFPSDGGADTYTVSSNTSWSAMSNQSWCELSQASGNGNGSFSVTILSNDDEPRSAIITVVTTSGVPARHVIIAIEQNGEIPSLTVSPESLSFPGAGTSQIFQITSNVEWTISSTQPWCTVSPASGSDNREITVTTETNTDSEPRTVFLDVTSGEIRRRVEITQMAYPHGGAADRITINALGELVLTNDPTDAGLYFKTGSVVGLFSANGANQRLPDTNTDSYDEMDVAFNPSNTPTEVFSSYTFIPYATSTDKAEHTLANVKAGRGDPCRLVGYTAEYVRNATVVPDNGKWRMASMEDNRTFTGQDATRDFTAHWWPKDMSPFSGVAGGEFPTRGNGGPGKFLPAAGYRDSDGKVAGQGDYGYYYTTSPNIYLGLLSSVINIDTYHPSIYGFNIRCVRVQNPN